MKSETRGQDVPEICVARHTCRICGGTEFAPVIDLGAQHIATAFISGSPSGQLLKRYPLELVRCSSQPGCGLVQLRHTIASSMLYTDYGYRSGINESMRANLQGIARAAEAMAGLKPTDTVLDIGCNDGTLLCSYDTPQLDRVGFDPAENVANVAREKGLNVVNNLFDGQKYLEVKRGKKARVVTSIAMFYDLEDPTKFVHDVAAVMADDGVWVIELSYLPAMLQHNSFDTICHEHLEYYSLKQIEWMLRPHGLSAYRIEINNVNGGSFRLFIRKGVPKAADAAAVEKIREYEQKLELDTDRPYQRFRDNSFRMRDELFGLIKDLNAAGKKVYVYGASTKGNTILEFCGLNSRWIAAAADRNPEKWGRHTLGTDIPIISEEQARSEAPDYFLVLPWHFFEGFVKREFEFLTRGGKFIVPLPEVKILGIGELSARTSLW